MTGAPGPARVAVLGLGLIGGSVARRLLDRGCAVVGWDPDGATREAARTLGIEILTAVQDLARADADLVVVAVPLRAVDQTAELLAGILGPQTVVTDVASVKAPVRSAMDRVGLGAQYVGAHPMAGTEHSGFDASSGDLLSGVRWAVTLDEATSERAFLMVAALITGAFDGVVFPLTDDVHDEAAALISHVPHVVATELLNLVAHAEIRPVAVGLAAGSFRDGTRVARTTPRRTQAMVTDNAAWVAPVLRRAIADLTRLAQSLESNGPTDEFFDRADLLRDDGDGGSATNGRTAAGTDTELTTNSESEPESESVRTIRLADLPSWQRELTRLGALGARVLEADPIRGTVLVVAPN
ncbi:prephenate dehydrogenase [Sanguibacter gelidistatuariae]|uniref:Prephenate dehydrogenase n=1 Tax=Sanguibacter gelidistatuariae TaxID=1814289 RepID=A0A1G6MED4_9MICO|nr:prephenate dehydrogenase/arogenate dehydrogenase family protein [Sanguibacter gelidistatuariae]SDC53932.1 prephenate dehydrogenase [Sanguibacter gelidistatuariae]